MEMPTNMTKNVVVIGSGIGGLSAAVPGQWVITAFSIFWSAMTEF